MSKVETLIEEIDKLSVNEIGEVIEVLMEKWPYTRNVLDKPPTIQVEEVKEEKIAFDVVLTGFAPEKRTNVIMQLRKQTQKGLSDCRDILDKSLPFTIVAGTDKAAAEKIAEEFKAAGGNIEVK